MNMSILLLRLRKFRILGIWLGILLGLYAMTGFLILPAVLKAQVPKRLGALLGRTVKLQRVRVNPFALSVTWDGFQILEPDGQVFLGWDRLYVDGSISGLFTRSLSFSKIHVAHLRGFVVVEKGGRMNFSDILDRLASGSSPAPQASQKPLDIRIGNLEILGAQVQLVDRSLGEPFTTTAGPVSFQLRGFRTVHDSGSPYDLEGRTESGESFGWKGRFSLDPLVSQGHFVLSGLKLPKYQPYVRDAVAFELREGMASLQASYDFHWTGGLHRVRIHEGSFQLQRLVLGDPGKKDAALELPLVEASGIQADLLEDRMEIASLRLQDGNLALSRLKDGSIDVVKLLTPKPRPAAAPSKPFHLRLEKTALEGFRVGFRDLSNPRPVAFSLRNLSLQLQGVTLDPGASMPMRLSTDLQETGHLSLEGDLRPMKGQADLALKLEGLLLAPLDPYLEPSLALRVGRGSLDLDGQVTLDFQGRKSDGVRFGGNLRLKELEVADAAQGEPFLRYQMMRLEGVNLSTAGRSLNVRHAAFLGAENRLVIAKDGSSNVARALKLAETPSVPAAAVPATSGDAYHVSLDRIAMKGGRQTFIDRSVSPNAALMISALEGFNTGLRTSAGGNARLELKGLAGGLAPLLIQGRAMPLRHDKDTDISMTIRGADLMDFSPYAGRYLGYTVRKGKLDVEAHVRIQDRRLTVEDKVRLDQFYLGDKVESPDATHLPVKLGLALLRDRRGVIEVEIPIDGSLDDPDFHYGRAVWKAVLNLLGKVAASPFTLLSKLFGGGADLSHAVFLPGRAELDPIERSKPAALARALYERPELTLELESTTDAADRLALQREKLEARLRELRSKAGQGVGEGPWLEQERERWLRVAYGAAFPASTAQSAPAVPPAEMEQRLLSGMEIGEDVLATLAEARSQMVLAAILKDGRVEARRLYRVSGSSAAKSGGGKIYFTLK